MSTQESPKRKTFVDEINDYNSDLKRVRLDPARNREKQFIGGYHGRNHALLPQNRQQLRVLISFERKNILDRIRVYITSSLVCVLRRRY